MSSVSRENGIWYNSCREQKLGGYPLKNLIVSKLAANAGIDVFLYDYRLSDGKGACEESLALARRRDDRRREKIDESIVRLLIDATRLAKPCQAGDGLG